MNQPTAITFHTLVTGWLLAPRPTIMGMVRASGTERYPAAFHRNHTGSLSNGSHEIFAVYLDYLVARNGVS